MAYGRGLTLQPPHLLRPRLSDPARSSDRNREIWAGTRRPIDRDDRPGVASTAGIRPNGSHCASNSCRLRFCRPANPCIHQGTRREAPFVPFDLPPSAACGNANPSPHACRGQSCLVGLGLDLDHRELQGAVASLADCLHCCSTTAYLMPYALSPWPGPARLAALVAAPLAGLARPHTHQCSRQPAHGNNFRSVFWSPLTSA